jgi:hypothetical protein
MRIARRTVLASAVAVPFFPRTAFAADNVSIRIEPRRRLRALPADYMGLSFEASAVATLGLLSADNPTYVQLVRTLGRKV